MIRALSARGRRSARSAAVLTLWVGSGCSGLTLGQAPALPGSEIPGRANPTEAPPPFSRPERERIASVQPWVDAAAYAYELEPDLINAVVWVESRFDPQATSPAGAQGLMQLMPATSEQLARTLRQPKGSSYDPEFNLTAGALYLRTMLDRYDGNLAKALAAYNAGPKSVDSGWGRSLPRRSREYVERVLDAKFRFEQHRESILAQTEKLLAQAPEDGQAATDIELPPRPPARAPAPEPAPQHAAQTSQPPRPAPSAPQPASPKPQSPGSPAGTLGGRPSSSPALTLGPGVLPSVLD